CSFISVDDGMERGRFDISLVDQYRFERAHPQLHLGKVGALIMIVIMCSHRRNIPNKPGAVPQKTEPRPPTSRHEVAVGQAEKNWCRLPFAGLAPGLVLDCSSF